MLVEEKQNGHPNTTHYDLLYGVILCTQYEEHVILLRRTEGAIQEYVKVVPFSGKTISADILARFEQQISFVYDLIQNDIRNNK